MKTFRAVLIIGIIEVLIGSLTLFGNLLLVLLNLNDKSSNVLLFIIITACISVLIGVGILKLKKAAFFLLLYFSSVIILTKLLIFAGIIHLNGELEITLHQALDNPATGLLRNTMSAFKNTISIGYHAFVIYFLLKPDVRSIFHR